MAEGKSMTAREAASKVMAVEHEDVLRESVAAMVREIMERDRAPRGAAGSGARCKTSWTLDTLPERAFTFGHEPARERARLWAEKRVGARARVGIG
jgi:hypothetical protein